MYAYSAQKLLTITDNHIACSSFISIANPYSIFMMKSYVLFMQSIRLHCQRLQRIDQGVWRKGDDIVRQEMMTTFTTLLQIVIRYFLPSFLLMCNSTLTYISSYYDKIGGNQNHYTAIILYMYFLHVLILELFDCRQSVMHTCRNTENFICEYCMSIVLVLDSYHRRHPNRL